MNSYQGLPYEMLSPLSLSLQKKIILPEAGPQQLGLAAICSGPTLQMPLPLPLGAQFNLRPWLPSGDSILLHIQDLEMLPGQLHQPGALLAQAGK